MHKQHDPLVYVNRIATDLNKAGFNEDEAQMILERLSLELNGNLYSYTYDPAEEAFRALELLYESVKTLPTEREILFALGKITDIAEGYLDKLDDDNSMMDFETFETLVESIVGKKVSGVPILNRLASVGEVVVTGDLIRW